MKEYYELTACWRVAAFRRVFRVESWTAGRLKRVRPSRLLASRHSSGSTVQCARLFADLGIAAAVTRYALYKLWIASSPSSWHMRSILVASLCSVRLMLVLFISFCPIFGFTISVLFAVGWFLIFHRPDPLLRLGPKSPLRTGMQRPRPCVLAVFHSWNSQGRRQSRHGRPLRRSPTPSQFLQWAACCPPGSPSPSHPAEVRYCGRVGRECVS